jgi:hypothetical protein
MDDETRPIRPVTVEPLDPMGIGPVSWPKVVLILGITLILVIGLVTIVALIFLPSEFWLVQS